LGVGLDRRLRGRFSLVGALALGVALETTVHNFSDGTPAFTRTSLLGDLEVHGDVGLGIRLGPGQVRVRPIDLDVQAGSDPGVAYRALVGYAVRL
jgi:hypothetical protein